MMPQRRSPSLSFLSLVLLSVFLFAHNDASAAAASNVEAKAHYEKGKSLYGHGKFDSALAELKEAYSLDPKPSLMRFMGDCAYKQNDYDLAVRYYENYLQDKPLAADKAAIAKKIATAKEQSAAQDDGSSAAAAGGSAREEGFSPSSQALAVKEARLKKQQELKNKRAKKRKTSAKSNRSKSVHSNNKRDEKAQEKRRKTYGSVPDYLTDTAKNGEDKPSEYGWVSAIKWTTLIGGLAGIATGITFSVLAKKKKDDIIDVLGTSCPTTVPNCGGNSSGNSPQVTYGYNNYRNEQDYNRMQGFARLGYAVGGGLLLTSAVTFLVSSIVWSEPDESYQDGSRRSRYSSNISTEGAKAPWFIMPTVSMQNSMNTAASLMIGADAGFRF